MSRLALLLIALAGSAQAEGPTSQTRPLARGEVPAGPPLRPKARPYDRLDLQHGIATRALFRAEQNLFAFSQNAIAQSLRPTKRPLAIELAAQERRGRRACAGKYLVIRASKARQSGAFAGQAHVASIALCA